MESTLSGRSLQRTLERARNEDYYVEIIFTFVESSEIFLERIQERVKSGGHNVPEEDVRRRFSRILTNFWTLYRHQADLWYLFYNGEAAFPLAAYGKESQVDLQNQEYFSLFLKALECHDEQTQA